MFKKKSNRTEKLLESDRLSSSERVLQGTAWLSLGLIVSRLIGALYIIPWARWIGEHYDLANALYALAYAPYVLFLDIAATGFPTALTKQISQLNGRGAYKASMQLFRNALLFMALLGVVLSGIFYFSAPFIANISIRPTPDVNDSIRVIQSLAPALLVLPVLSILRGFFLGFQQSTAPAVSQIIEQVVRVAYMLIMTYYVMYIQRGSFVDAVIQSTFAAFVGSIVALVFLAYEYFKAADYFHEKVSLGSQTIQVSRRDSLIIVTKESIPFILMSMGSSLVQTIDQVLYSPVMRDFSNYTLRQIAVTYAWFGANVQKLLSIVGSVITAVTTMTIPSVALLYAKGNQKELSKAVMNTIQLFFFLVLPAAVGLFAVSEPIYRVFYVDANGVGVLRLSTLYLFILGFNSVLISIFQGMGKHRITLQALSLLVLGKLAVYVVLVALFKENGAVLSTVAAASLSVYFLLYNLTYIVSIDKQTLFDSLTKIVWASVVMLGATGLVATLLGRLWAGNNSMLVNVVQTVLIGLVGVCVYAYMSLKNGMLEALMPKQAIRIKRLVSRFVKI